MRTLLRWLADQLDWLAHRPEGEAALDEIRYAITSLRNAIDTSASMSYIGPCDECKRDLYAVEGRDSVTCPDCGLAYDVGERREWLLSLWRDRLGTAVEISRALSSWAGLDVTPERIRVLAQRDRIARHTAVVGGRERSVYRFGEVEEQARADAVRRAEGNHRRGVPRT